MPKARVLPDPVGDLARTSRPASASGTTMVWMGKGDSMPRAASAAVTGADAPRPANVSWDMLSLYVGCSAGTRRLGMRRHSTPSTSAGESVTSRGDAITARACRVAGAGDGQVPGMGRCRGWAGAGVDNVTPFDHPCEGLAGASPPPHSGSTSVGARAPLVLLSERPP